MTKKKDREAVHGVPDSASETKHVWTDVDKEIEKNNQILAELVPEKRDFIHEITPVQKETTGKTLVNLAVHEVRREKTDNVLKQVQKLVKELETARLWEKNNRDCAEIIERRIKAIEDGEFKLEKIWHGVTMEKIVYNDDSLNRPYPHQMGFGI